MENFACHFGRYRLVAAKRELWRDGDLVATPRLVFDGLLYLVRHRDRAVGRDELVAAVWGRVDVTDGQVNQLMLRVRRVFGQETDPQAFVRTVPGFGYRWVHEVHESDGTSDPVVVDPAAGEPETAFGAERSMSTRPLWIFGALLFVTLGALLLAGRIGPRKPAPVLAAGQVFAVLPMEVSAPADASWVRLGAMDLVAQRMRDAGLRVPPSENVMIALRGATFPHDEHGVERIARSLGADVLIRGLARRSAEDWQVDLSATATGGVRRSAQSADKDVIKATRRAADSLLAALGHPPPAVASDSAGGADARLQQVQAALLAGELATARTILESDPAALERDPRFRLRLAQVDARSGRMTKAEEAYTALLDDPAVRDDPLLRGRVLSARGAVYGRRTEFAKAEQDFEDAVAALENARSPTDLGRALNQRGVSRTELGRYREAAADLGSARIEFEQAGDRLGLIQSDTNLGLLEAKRGRIEKALPYLTDAVDRFEAFGAPERMLAVLVDVFDAEAAMLRWPDALAATERQRAQRDRAGDPGLALLIGVNRGIALTELGRYREAEETLGETQAAYGTVRADAARYLHAATARLALRQGRFADAVKAADTALSMWPPGAAPDEKRAHLILVRQRALVAMGAATADIVEPELRPLARGESNVAPALIVASAEWARHRQRDAEAERDFRAALNAADARGVPADIALAAVSYADWLLELGRVDEAAALAGRVATWADRDYDCALLQVAVLRSRGPREAWIAALHRAEGLAGERTIPDALASPDAAPPVTRL